MVTLKQINDGRARHGMPPIMLPGNQEIKKEVQTRPRAAKRERALRVPAPKAFWLVSFVKALLWTIIVVVCGVISACVTLMIRKPGR